VLGAEMIHRLLLNPARLQGIAADLRQVAELPDPVGEVFEGAVLPNGLQVHKQRVPLGVLAVIYEARPNVTLDVAGLALKTGNAAILRGGSETLRSNRALVTVVRQALGDCGLPADAIQLIDDPDRALVMELLQMYETVDMLIPRGGAALHQFCRQNSRVPVITGGIGICHLFVDESADLEAAVKVIFNAKVQRPTVCNALDTALVHRTVAAQFLPAVVAGLEGARVTFRADASALPYLSDHALGHSGTQAMGHSGVQALRHSDTQELGHSGTQTVGHMDAQDNGARQGARLAAQAAAEGAGGLPASVLPAGEGDFDTEWLSLVLGLKVVDSLDEAIAHIAAHSTAHSDGILTADPANAARFVAEVDSAAVYVNASTRFTDGSQLGLGAEVAISTQRLHARGPMGLRELTTYKWVVQGDYQVRP
jgi:glutamate-5-semialdehyde dehydrogenase